MTKLTHQQIHEQIDKELFSAIDRMLAQGLTQAEIARKLNTPESKIAIAVRQAVDLKIFIPDTVRYAPTYKIKAVDYSSHDELNRHYAGCEFEDTRPPELRGLDWPPMGRLSAV